MNKYLVIQVPGYRQQNQQLGSLNVCASNRTTFHKDGCPGSSWSSQGYLALRTIGDNAKNNIWSGKLHRKG